MEQQALRALLTDCVGESPVLAGGRLRLERLAESDWGRLLELAASQRVAPLLYRRLTEDLELDGVLPPDRLDELRQRFRSNTLRNLALYRDLHTMLVPLVAEKIPVIALKGTCLAESVYGRIGLREMADVDLLVRVEDLGRVARIFEARGFRPEKPFELETDLASRKHLPALVRSGSPRYEIHWNLVLPGQPYSVEIDSFWQRAVAVRLAGVELLALSVEDLILHLCSHAAHGHALAFGLRPLCDLAAVIRHGGGSIDWPRVVERARRLGWQRAAYLALRLASELVSAAVPHQVLAELEPRDVDEGLLATGREQVFSDLESSRLLPPNLAQLWAPRAPFGGRAGALGRLFSSQAVASRYALPIGSWKVAASYPRLVLDLLLSFFRTLLELRRSGRNLPYLTGLARRRTRLHEWLQGERPG